MSVAAGARLDERDCQNAMIAGRGALEGHSVAWRATLDEDEHYVYAIALPERIAHSHALEVNFGRN